MIEDQNINQEAKINENNSENSDRINTKFLRYKYNISEFYENDIIKITNYVRLVLDKEKFDFVNVNLKKGYTKTTTKGLFVNKVYEDNGTIGIIIDARWYNEEKAIKKTNIVSGFLTLI